MAPTPGGAGRNIFGWRVVIGIVTAMAIEMVKAVLANAALGARAVTDLIDEGTEQVLTELLQTIFIIVFARNTQNQRWRGMLSSEKVRSDEIGSSSSYKKDVNLTHFVTRGGKSQKLTLVVQVLTSFKVSCQSSNWTARFFECRSHWDLLLTDFNKVKFSLGWKPWQPEHYTWPYCSIWSFATVDIFLWMSMQINCR